MRKQLQNCILLFLFLFSARTNAQTAYLQEVDTIMNPKLTGAVIKDDYLYLHSWDGPLNIYSLTNPASPAWVNTVNIGMGGNHLLSHYVNNLFVYDGYSNTLRMVDITNRTNPQITDTLQLTASGNSLKGPFMTHSLTHTYIANYDSLYVINTTDSSNIFLETTIPSPQIGSFGYGQLAIFDTVLYITNGETVHVFNISNPALPDYWTAFTPIQFTDPVSVWNLSINEDDSILYLGDWNVGHGHQAFDISNPLWPQFQFRGPGATANNLLQFDHNNIVQQTFSGGICVFQTDTDTSVVIDTLNGSLGNVFRDIDIRGDYFYISKSEGLEVIYLNRQTVGIPEPQSELPDFTLYPNPTTDEIHIRFAKPTTTITLEIVDCTGKVILQINATGDREERINLTTFPTGMYWVTIKQNGQVRTTKSVVKQ